MKLRLLFILFAFALFLCIYHFRERPMRVVAYVGVGLEQGDGCGHFGGHISEKWIDSLQAHDVTDGITPEFIRAQQYDYDTWRHSEPTSCNKDLILEARRDKGGRKWGMRQKFIIIGTGDEFQKCFFSLNWYEKNKTQVHQIAIDSLAIGGDAYIDFQSEELYKKELDDNNGIGENSYLIGLSYTQMKTLDVKLPNCYSP